MKKIVLVDKVSTSLIRRILQRDMYTVIITEWVALPAGFQMTSDGTVITPTGMKCFVNSFGARKKTFSNLLPKTEYFVYYVLTYGKTVGVVSAGKSIVTSA